MGKTITEKILQKASGMEVRAGDFVRFVLNNIVINQLCQEEFEELGVFEVFDPEKIKIVIGGHRGSADKLEDRYSAMLSAKKLGIPQSNIVDLGSGGIEHHVSIERGWTLPGTVFMGGIDGQTPIHGAMGCVAAPLSHEHTHGHLEPTAVLLTGKAWMRVPPSMMFELRGKLQDAVTARDVFEWILGEIGPSGAMGAMMEFRGPLVEEMNVDERLALCCNSAFTGAFSGIINPDEKTIEYVKGRNDEPFEPLTSDPDAKYVKTFNFDFSSIGPQVVVPPKRHIVKPVEELEGTKIDRAFIGSCANGSLHDMRVAARLLEGREVAPNVLLNVTPATVETLSKAAKEGLVNLFMDAGAIIPAPACGMCIGCQTPLVGDEVCVATSTCNYPGRMGSMEAQIYLASPATVAASAIAGKIVDPRKYL